MELVTLVRDDVSTACIRGTLGTRGTVFQTLERPWLDNAPNTSCIPAGRYTAAFLPSSPSGKYRNVFWVKNVPGRGGILIHAGNVASQSKGCILLGARRGMLAGQPAVLNSRTALGEFMDLMGHDDFTLHILGGETAGSTDTED